MQNFILNIFQFLRTIYSSLLNIVTSFGLNDEFFTFINKNLFNENSIIGLNITYKELLLYFGTLFLTIFFIVLFVKFVFYIIKWVGGFLSD